MWSAPNPYTGKTEGVITEMHFDTGQVFHVHRDGERELSQYDVETWVKRYQREGIAVPGDDLLMDEGL